MDVVKQADVSGAIAGATKQPLDIREHVEREDYQTIGAPFVTDPKMTARNVNVYYGDKQSITNVSLDVGRNEVIAMIGPSGIWSRHWAMIRALCRISSMRTQ